MRIIPALKAQPDTILRLLQIIDDNEGSYSAISDAIYEYLISRSNRKSKPSRKNLVRAVSLPSLRHLKVVQGEVNETRLSPQGNKILLDSFLNNIIDDKQFRRNFAQHLVRLESKYYIGVINILLQLNTPTIKIEAIYNEVTNINNTISLDRLKKWLGYLRYVGIISYNKSKFEYIVNTAQINSLKKVYKKPNLDEFKEALILNYNKLSRSASTLGYVPIPRIKDEVCLHFDAMWDDHFYELITQIEGEDEANIISFFEPMKSHEGGIKINGTYYYYIYIRKKEELV